MSKLSLGKTHILADLLKFERNLVEFDPEHIGIIKSFCKHENVAHFMPRCSPPEVSLWKGFLKICNKFTGQHWYQSVKSIKFQSNSNFGVLPDIFPLHGRQFIESWVCSSDSKSCTSYMKIDLTLFHQWEKSGDGRTGKNGKNRKLPNLMNTFESKLRKFLFRYFINKQQTVVCISCKHLVIFESSKQQWFKWTSLKRFLCIPGWRFKRALENK